MNEDERVTMLKRNLVLTKDESGRAWQTFDAEMKREGGAA